MTQILDHVKAEPLLDSVDHWPRTASRQEWFAITRRKVQSTIAGMDLDATSLSEVEESFIAAGLLR